MFFIQEDTCPNCGIGKIIRDDFYRHGMCSKKCGIMLGIPSQQEPGRKVGILTSQGGDGPVEKITWERYISYPKFIRDFYLRIRR